MFLAYLEAEIWPRARSGGPGGTGAPKKGLGGSKKLIPDFFVDANVRTGVRILAFVDVA